jgi:hypothetical protein
VFLFNGSFLVGEEFVYVRLLLPEVDGFLELHLAFGVQNIQDADVLDESVTLEFLTDLCSHLGNWITQFVSFGNSWCLQKGLVVGSFIHTVLHSHFA